MSKPPASVYQIKVTLNDSHPPIWRRVLVPGSVTLLELHVIVQRAMGWTDSHLHLFEIDGRRYGDPQVDEGGEIGLQPEARFGLSRVMPATGARGRYEYDFGDGWEHTLLVEKILPLEPGAHYPRCLAGKGACPPEDVGGVWGYQHFLEAIGNPRHPEHAELLEWIGGEFDPADFDVERVNARLRHKRADRGPTTASAWDVPELIFASDQSLLESAWARELSPNDQALAESLPLRRDLLTLLTYVRDQRVTGTQSTGNLPLKAIRAICAGFVHPLQLDRAIGKQVFRVRSETEVWPLFFVHVLASLAGLITGGPGRRWQLTPLGERFVAAPAPQQVWVMLVTWWTGTNWALASPWVYGAGELPFGLRGVALLRLLALPVGEVVAFEPFADRLIKDAQLVWPIPDQANARNILRALVTRVVINPHRDFGILATEYGPNPVLGPEYQELVALRLTPFGKGLLAAFKTVARL